MDAYDCIATKLDVREFDGRRVPAEIKLKILEAARLTGSSMNSQHWRFILVQSRENIARLARDSKTGGWVEGADFAVVVLTDPRVPGRSIDAGRVAQDMQLAAWNFGVASCLYTGIKQEEIRRDFEIPHGLDPEVVLGFGYPKRRIRGRKSRRPVKELAFLERYGKPVDVDRLDLG